MALAAAEMATMGGGSDDGRTRARARGRRRRREWRGRGGGEEALSSDDATKTHALFLASISRLSHDAFDVLIGSF